MRLPEIDFLLMQKVLVYYLQDELQAFKNWLQQPENREREVFNPAVTGGGVA